MACIFIRDQMIEFVVKVFILFHISVNKLCFLFGVVHGYMYGNKGTIAIVRIAV